jgi:hypothetical protein
MSRRGRKLSFMTLNNHPTKGLPQSHPVGLCRYERIKYVVSNLFGSIPGPESSTATIIESAPLRVLLTCGIRRSSLMASIASIALCTKLGDKDYALAPKARVALRPRIPLGGTVMKLSIGHALATLRVHKKASCSLCKFGRTNDSLIQKAPEEVKG